MSDSELIDGLSDLASAADDVVIRSGSIHTLAETYERLRDRARALNDRHGWATADEFETQLPTCAGLAMIDSLNVWIDQNGSRSRIAQMPHRIRRPIVRHVGEASGREG
jgi:hypothetical protein